MCDSLSTSFISLIYAFLMVLRRETTIFRSQGKRPAELSQPDQTEARRKARYDTTLFSSVEEYQRHKQKFAQKKIVQGRVLIYPNFNISGLRDFSYGWDGYQ